MSPAGIDTGFVQELEGFRSEGYVPRKNNGEVNGDSGVTIGNGVDLGQMNKRDLDNLVNNHGVDPELAEKLEPYLGLTKDEAIDFLEDNPLTITREEAAQLSQAKYEEIAGTLERLYDRAQRKRGSDVRFRDLPPRVKTIAFSVATQLGPNFGAEAEITWRHLLNQDYGALRSELRNFGGETEPRRRREANYLGNL